jgi:hypothetical protein
MINYVITCFRIAVIFSSTKQTYKPFRTKLFFSVRASIVDLKLPVFGLDQDWTLQRVLDPGSDVQTFSDLV